MEENRNQFREQITIFKTQQNITLQAQFMDKIIDKLEFTKSKNVCLLKGNVERMRRKTTDRETTFASDKRLLSKMHKEL